MPDNITTDPQTTNSVSPPTEGAEPAAPPPHRHSSFLERVGAFLKGHKKPDNEVAQPLVEDLRGVAAEQEQIRRQMQELQETAQKAQAALLQAEGKADALLQVLHRLEVGSDK